MDIKIEKRKALIINFIYFLTLGGVFYFFTKYILFLFMPFIIALLISVLIQKPINFLASRTKIKRSYISIICLVFLLIVVSSILTVLIFQVINEFKGFFNFISLEITKLPETFESIKSWILSVLHMLPSSIEPDVREYITTLSIDNFVKTIGEKFEMSWIISPIGGVWQTAKQIPNFIISVFITIISSFFLTLDYHRFKDFFYNQFPKDKLEKVTKTKNILFSSAGKMFKAYSLIMLITGAEVFIGLSLLRFFGLYEGRYVLSIAIITAIVDILPVLGSGTVLIPWGVYSLIVGDIGFGVGLLIIYFIIAVIRQIIEPKLVANQVGLPAIVTIMGMYIGAKTLGPLGLFIVPFIIILIKLLNDEGIISIFKPKNEDSEDEEPENEKSENDFDENIKV